jgi:YD repeat-containing protein
VLTQDGDTYTWQAAAFNTYAQVTQTTRSNSIAGQSAITEQTSYRNDTALWVLGLPLQITNVTTGEVESAFTYDPGNDTVLSRARFGQTLMNYTFDSAGQLASFTDGNAHTTTLGSYKRGIPQAIGYPDGTTQSLAVDDFGQVTSMTDQAGSTTSYGYDPVGRLTRINFPTGDEQAWYPQVFTYDYVTTAERGLAANHWRRTVVSGDARTLTWFDVAASGVERQLQCPRQRLAYQCADRLRLEGAEDLCLLPDGWQSGSGCNQQRRQQPLRCVGPSDPDATSR